MLTYKKLFNKPGKLLRFTGLTVNQFIILVNRLKPLWKEIEFNRLFRQNRIRSIGGGRQYRLKTTEDKLLLILLWYRTYTIYELLGWIFNLDGTNIGRMINKVTPLIEKVADYNLVSVLKNINKKRKKIRNWDEFVNKFPDLAEIIIDATEQRRKRPVNNKKQRNFYSGKKHAHSLKTQIAVTRKGLILHISKSYPGRIHDKKILDKEKTIDKIPRKIKKRLDSGYDGIVKDHPLFNIYLPYKRRRNHQVLTRGEKQANTIRSKRRIIVENTICRMKKYAILSQTYRSSEKAYNQHVRNIAALCNFRLLFKEKID